MRKAEARRPPRRRGASTGSGRRVSIDSYRGDPLYPPIVRAVEVLLTNSNVVAPVDVGRLDPRRLEDWRFGRVPYLEMVLQGNLGRLSRLLRILRFHAHDLNLVPSLTVYMRWGKGPKQRLRFTRSGAKRLEEAYSRHFVWPGKPFRFPGIEREATNRTRTACGRQLPGTPTSRPRRLRVQSRGP